MPRTILRLKILCLKGCEKFRTWGRPHTCFVFVCLLYFVCLFCFVLFLVMIFSSETMTFETFDSLSVAIGVQGFREISSQKPHQLWPVLFWSSANFDSFLQKSTIKNQEENITKVRLLKNQMHTSKQIRARQLCDSIFVLTGCSIWSPYDICSLESFF